MLARLHRNSRIAVIAITLFLVFDFAALALNFWLSWKIEQQAIAINLSGRQRMLSQRMVKCLLLIERTHQRGADIGPTLAELKLTHELFSNTLLGFARGHITKGGNSKPLFLPAVNGEEARRLVAEAEGIWQPYEQLVLGVIQADPAGLETALEPALEYAVGNNLKLLDLMNRLTTELEVQTQREAVQIRWFQGAAFLLALLNFFGAMALYLHRMRLMSRSHGLLDSIINKVPTCVVVVANNNRIIKANHTAERLFGYATDSLVGKSINELLIRSGNERHGVRSDGSRFLAAQKVNEVMMDNADVTIMTISDITQQRKTEAHLNALAYHDMLTSLPNRQLFDDRLAQEIAHAERNSSGLGLLFLDLDRFKPVNDAHGHEVGDKLLQQTAARLKSSLREVDTVSRWGGDEFTILLPQVGDRTSCEKVAHILIEQLGKPFEIDGLQLNIGASVGIALYPEDGKDAQTLISHADETMYRAKQAGRNTFR